MKFSRDLSDLDRENLFFNICIHLNISTSIRQRVQYYLNDLYTPFFYHQVITIEALSMDTSENFVSAESYVIQSTTTSDWITISPFWNWRNPLNSTNTSRLFVSLDKMLHLCQEQHAISQVLIDCSILHPMQTGGGSKWPAASHICILNPNFIYRTVQTPRVFFTLPNNRGGGTMYPPNGRSSITS